MSESDQHVLNIESEDSYSVGTGDSINITWDESALTDGLLSEYTVTLNITMVMQYKQLATIGIILLLDVI